jgi:hypothetical protein
MQDTSCFQCEYFEETYTQRQEKRMHWQTTSIITYYSELRFYEAGFMKIIRDLPKIKENLRPRIPLFDFDVNTSTYKADYKYNCDPIIALGALENCISQVLTEVYIKVFYKCDDIKRIISAFIIFFFAAKIARRCNLFLNNCSFNHR